MELKDNMVDSNSELIVITPVKNEINQIKLTVNSMLAQQLRPVEWLLIDDHSIDGTYEFLITYLSEYSWIKVIRNDFINFEEKGARIAKIFNYAWRNLVPQAEFISKLDADVSFAPDFYKNMIDFMNLYKDHGIISGNLVYNGKKEEILFPFMTRGATKLYRWNCLQEIGGLIESTGWDTFDNIKAMRAGWKTLALTLPFNHNKPEGMTQGSFRRYYEAGNYCGRIPYYLPYFIAKTIYRIFERPILISTALLWIGYIRTRYFRRDFFEDRESCDYFRIIQKKIIKNKIGF